MSRPTSGQEQRIFEVAKQLFTQRGFSNVAVREICRGARVTPPTLYYYFKSKGALFDAIVNKTISMSEFIDQLTNECEKPIKLKARIQAFTKTYLSCFPRDHLNVGLYLRHSTQLDSIGSKALSAEFARIETLLVKLIREGIAKGEGRKTDPRMAAECLLGMMNRFVFQRIHFHRNFNAQEASSYLTDFFMRAIFPTKLSGINKEIHP